MRFSKPEFLKKINKIFKGNAVAVLKKFPANTIDLIVTSPPYADRRKQQYGGPPPDEYVEWFMPFADEFKRVLKPRGSLILNIKEHADGGEREIYVLELILEMRKQGWYWVEDYIWHKMNSFPGKWPNRFRGAWEHCLHFTKEKNFKMYQEAVKVPIGAWAHSRMKKLGPADRVRMKSRTKSGFGRQLTNWIGKRKVYPSNVLYLPTVSTNKNHCAAFPEALPAWFIKLFSKKQDVVLDPFVGCGTTALAAMKLERNFIGVDRSKKYSKLAKAAVRNFSRSLKRRAG